MDCFQMSENELKPSREEINHILKEIQKGNNKILEDTYTKYPTFHWTQLYYEKTGDTVLHCASRLGFLNTIEFLLQSFYSKSVDCKNKNDKTALHEAAQFSQYEACERLLYYGADVNALRRSDWTPLMLACIKVNGENSLRTVEVLLKNGALVNYKNKDGWTVLHLICREGDPRILKILLKYGLDANLKTNNGRTALHIAALHGNIQIIKILLGLGLDINEKDSCGNTPLHEAILCDNMKVCKILIENNALVHVRNNRGYSVLHLAASEGHLDVIDFILSDLKLDINETTVDGFTALHCATRNGHRETFDYLVVNGADVTIRDKCGRYPLSYLLR